MIRFSKALFGVVTIIFGSIAWAYGVNTHERLSTEAYDISQLRKDPKIFRSIGIRDTDKFKNSDNQDRTIQQLIGDGARFEDNGIRPRFHFYDPIYNTGLIWGGPFAGSPDWALEDRFSNPTQDFSFSDARQYLYNALTLPTQEMRDRNFGSAFETLGHVIHHLQDMAQPQHVRNDVHLDRPEEILGIPNPLYNRSAYELYTDTHRSELPFVDQAGLYKTPVYPGTDPTLFNTARKFWVTQEGSGGTGLGIAEFTNNNFVSAGTNHFIQITGL